MALLGFGNVTDIARKAGSYNERPLTEKGKLAIIKFLRRDI